MAIFKKPAPYPGLTKAVAIFIIVLAPSLANNGNMKKPAVPKQLSNAILRDGRQDDSGLPYVEELAREQSTTTADVTTTTTTTTETPEARTPESPSEISTSTR